MNVDGRVIDVSNEDKVYFPDEGITKGEIVEYHRRIADRMLPYLEGRPLVMRRFPDGIDGDGFFQKDTPDHFPDWIETVDITKRGGGEVTHVVAGDVATLIYLANQGAIEIHTLLAPAASPENPDQLIVDLDPSTGDVEDVIGAARVLREVLEDLGLTSFVKSTGSRGVHAHLRLDGDAPFDEVRATAKALAERVVERDPDLLTVAHAKKDRGDRVFVDWLRNGYGQHAVVPYGVRARPGAPVAVPLDWEEVTTSSFEPRRYTVRNVFRRLGQKDDPWAGIGQHSYSCSSLRDRLV